MAQYEAIFFDLDGTLIDTAPDMGGALNRLLNAHHLPVRTMEAIRPHVSDGANALIKMGFPRPVDDSEMQTLRQEYLQIYSEHLADESQLFDGMGNALDAIEKHRIPWGIVTNKPAWLTEPLLEQLDLRQRCACVVSADTCSQRKPHPMPMYHACELAHVKPENCLYVGDALRDIQAGNAAGMATLIARYGYITPGECTSTWRAGGSINHPDELLNWL